MILKKFKKWFERHSPFSSRRYIPIREVLGDQSNLSDIASSLFVHEETINEIQRDVVILIISNNFIIDSAIMMSFFNRNYEFSVSEFIILAFKVGVMSKFYMENPISLLKDAIELKDTFSDESIAQLKIYLKEQEDSSDQIFKEDHEKFQIKLEKDKKESKLGAEDIEANALIDEWLAKNKKKS